MKVLMTSSRMPFAVDEIRKLAHAGHEVYASDTFGAAPGSHSSYLAGAFVTPAPRDGAREFIEAIKKIVDEHQIRLVVPAFEEVFYLMKHVDEFADIKSRIFAPPFETLALLHNKATFVEWCQRQGYAVPVTKVARTNAELAEAIEHFDEYFARPAYSRAGVSLLTNTGPLKGAVKLEDAEPTLENPWLVQEFVHGNDIVSFSIVRRGKVQAHSTYVHPMTIEHAGGIVFESVDEPRTLEFAQQVAQALDYTGQLSFDFMDTPNGLVAIECNPRPTAGVTVMPDDMFARALCGEPLETPMVAPAGERVKISSALLRELFFNWREAPTAIRELFSDSRDVFSQKGDRWVAVWQVLSFGHVLRYRQMMEAEKREHRARSDLLAGFLFDITWDGTPIP